MENVEKQKPSELKPWLKYLSEEALDAEFPKFTLYGYLKHRNRDRLDDVALHYYGTNITFRKFFADIEACASAFAALGVKEGDVVSFLSVSIPETVTAIYAANKLGATVNALDPRMDVDNLRRMIQEAESSVLVALDITFPKILRMKDDIAVDKIVIQSAARSLPPIKKLYKKLTTKTQVIYGPDVISWDDFLADGKGIEAREAPYVGNAGAAITYTGGTTGFPKGVVLTNDSMNAISLNIQYSTVDRKTNDRFLGIIPVFTSYGLAIGMHMTLTCDLQLVLVPSFEPTELGDIIKKYRPQHMIGVPAYHALLMESKALKNLNMSFMKSLISGGDTMNEGLESRLMEWMKAHKMPYPLSQGYGMSEVSAAASFCLGNCYKPGSIGIPSLVTTIGIFKPDTFEELDFNEEGELCITGPTMMREYFKRPEETANIMRLHPDGQVWIHSGDIGYMDEDGFLFVQGRVKRMITRFDGHKVFPVNIESLVAEHPMVRNCCVFSVTDLDHHQGHYPMVSVMLIDGDKDAICQEIYDLCQERLEERGRPVGVICVEEIPLTAMGKNDYRSMEAEYGEMDYHALGQDRTVKR